MNYFFISLHSNVANFRPIADGHAVNLYSTIMLFFSTILSPEHVYVNNISQFKSFVNSRRIFLEKRILMKIISLENKMLLL